MKLERFSPFLAATLLLASSAAVADEATEAQVRNVDVRKIVVAGADADAPRTGLFVSRVQTNGEEPVTQLQVLGSGAEAIELDDLLDGQTRSFELGDGRWADITRDGDLLRLEIDGEEIEVPMNPAANGLFPGLAGLDAEQRVKVFMVAGDELGGAHEVMTFIGEDGSVQHPAHGEDFQWNEDGGAFHWRQDGDATIGSRVVVKRIGGEDGADGENVQVLAFPAMPLHGMLGGAPDFENLEALEGADPETRERVVAALKEILGGHHAVRIDVDAQGAAPAAGERKIIVRHAAPAEVR